MEDWATDWLKRQREKGSKGLEIKKIGSSHYVYRSTTVWDKEEKKRKKRSKYIGRLDEKNGLQEKESMLVPASERVVKQYGNAVLLNRAMADITELLKGSFPDDWQELYALSMLRVLGDVPLRRAQSSWDKLYNITGIKPDLAPNRLAEMLRHVGTDKKAQAKVFNGLCVAGDEVVYGMSAYFTRSEQTDLLGRRPDDSGLMQRINLAMIFSMDTGAPTMVRTLSNPVGELGPMRKLLDEIGGEGMTLVLERDSFSDEVVSLLLQRKVSFVLPVNRDSDLYDMDIELARHFFHDKHLIKCGKRRHKSMWLYLYQDAQLKMEEELTLYRMLDENRLGKRTSWTGATSPAASCSPRTRTSVRRRSTANTAGGIRWTGFSQTTAGPWARTGSSWLTGRRWTGTCSWRSFRSARTPGSKRCYPRARCPA